MGIFGVKTEIPHYSQDSNKLGGIKKVINMYGIEAKTEKELIKMAIELLHANDIITDECKHDLTLRAKEVFK